MKITMRMRLARVLGSMTLVAMMGTSALHAQTRVECGGHLPAEARLPDLVNIVPLHVNVHEAHQQHRLRFTVGLANIGEGPMELAPAAGFGDPKVLVTADQNLYSGPTNASGAPVCSRSLADAFEFHPEHNHWHLAGINGFEVRAALDDGSAGRWNLDQAVGSVKEGFCLIDYAKMSDEQLAEYGIDRAPREYFDCAGVHGVSRGWIDYYHHSTHGQYVDITGAPEGIYYLVVTANPNKNFIERDYGNNRAWVSFALRYNNSNNAVISMLHDSVTQAGEGLRPPSRTNR